MYSSIQQFITLMSQSLHKYTQTHVLYTFYCTYISHLVSIWDHTMGFYIKNRCNLGSVFFEGLKMTQ